MASLTVDRTDGLSSSTAIKGPCRVATTANIALTGEQTIDGVAVVADDRVLVKSQDDASEHGIYVAAARAWRRAADFIRSNDGRTGTRVYVTDGTSGPAGYALTTDNPISVGTTNLTFTLFSGGLSEYVETADIGTTVQAQDDKLDTFIALTWAADRLPYFTSASAIGLATFTSFGRSLVDDADASAGRTTLGVAYASQAQAEAGAASTVVMTPQRTAQAIAALVADNGVGVGQTWQDVTASRTVGTSYQNTTGRPIMVVVGGQNNSSGHLLDVSSDGATWITVSNVGANTRNYTTSIIVPDDWYYRAPTGTTVSQFTELR